MARFIPRTPASLAHHALAPRHDRLHHRQRPAERRRPDDPRAVRAPGERRRAEREARHRPAAHRPVPRHAAARRHLDFGNSYVNGQPVLPQLAAAMARSAKLAGLALVPDHPDRHRGRALRGAPTRPGRRPGHRPARRDVVVDPGVRDRDGPRRGRRGPAQAAAGPRDAAAERRRPDPGPLPAHAGDGDGDRLLRLHRADDAGRHDRRPPVRLHADGDDEGPERPARRCAGTSCATRSSRRSRSSRSRSATCSAGSSPSRRSSTTTAWARRCCSRPSARTSRC